MVLFQARGTLVVLHRSEDLKLRLPSKGRRVAVGPVPRIFLASRSMTDRSAPTASAKSTLLMTSRSDCVMPWARAKASKGSRDKLHVGEDVMVGLQY